MIELNKSEVVFNQEEHSYTLNGVRLQGVTDMIHRHLFPDEYAGVPEENMNNAAKRGTYIHQVCELMDELGIEPEIEEGKSYASIIDLHGLLHEASEYLVSDNKHFASCIDKVYREGASEFTLGDIKTTSKLNEEYVRWQLSIYAYLFELQNPECKAVRLIAIWLRESKFRVVELERISSDEVKRLLECEVSGVPFTTSIVKSGVASLPEKYREMEVSIINTDNLKKYWEAERKKLTSGIMKEMVSAGVYSWEGEQITITRTKESTRRKFDEESFKNDHKELYEKYLIDVPTSSSLRLNIKKTKTK